MNFYIDMSRRKSGGSTPLLKVFLKLFLICVAKTENVGQQRRFVVVVFLKLP